MAHETPICIRPATPDDLSAVLVMGTRCSRHSLLARFHAPVPALPRRHVARALAGAAGRAAFVATRGPGTDVVALAEWCDLPDGTGEVALLVEDRWQRCGVGRALLAALVEHAHAGGATAVVATVASATLAVAVRLAEPVAGRPTCVLDGPTATLRYELHPREPRGPATGQPGLTTSPGRAPVSSPSTTIGTPLTTVARTPCPQAL